MDHKLRNAVETDDVKAAKHILHQNRDIDLNRRLGSMNCYTTLLMLACKRGCVDMVKLLTTKRKKPADVNMPDSSNNYPISEAVKNQHIELLIFLLETNANPNIYCGKPCDTTPLIMACDLGDMDIVKLLIANKADVNMLDFLGGCPIWAAVTSQNLELTSFLLHNTAANPNRKVKRRPIFMTISRTPLIEACHMQSMNMVKLLLENKSCPVDINMADGKGVRPLSVALETENLDLVYMLLHIGGASIDLNYACDRNATIHYRQPGCRDFKVYNYYLTPLMQAIEMKNEVLVSDLIKAGADVNPHNMIQKNIINYSPLMEAVFQHNLDICTTLLRNGSDVNAVSSTNTHSKTALTIAAESFRPNYLAIVALLLEHGATHPVSKCGRSLLMCAALSHNKAEMVDLVMKHGHKFRKYPSLHNPSVFRDELCDALEAYSEDCCITLLEWGFNVKANDYPYFLTAVEMGTCKLVGILIQLNPQFLQENWLIKNYIPSRPSFRALYIDFHDFSELLRKLQEARKQPTTLQELCKAAVLQKIIFKSQQKTISAQINNLHLLPTLLKKFLMIKKEHVFLK